MRKHALDNAPNLLVPRTPINNENDCNPLLTPHFPTQQILQPARESSMTRIVDDLKFFGHFGGGEAGIELCVWRRGAEEEVRG